MLLWASDPTQNGLATWVGGPIAKGEQGRPWRWTIHAIPGGEAVQGRAEEVGFVEGSPIWGLVRLETHQGEACTGDDCQVELLAGGRSEERWRLGPEGSKRSSVPR
jgi:hypothetical protein